MTDCSGVKTTETTAGFHVFRALIKILVVGTDEKSRKKGPKT